MKFEIGKYYTTIDLDTDPLNWFCKYEKGSFDFVFFSTKRTVDVKKFNYYPSPRNFIEVHVSDEVLDLTKIIGWPNSRDKVKIVARDHFEDLHLVIKQS